MVFFGTNSGISDAVKGGIFGDIIYIGIPTVDRFTDYIFLENYSLNTINSTKNYKKGDIVKVKTNNQRGVVSEFRDAIDKGVLITVSDKNFIDKYPTKIKSLVSKSKDIKSVKDENGKPMLTAITYENQPILVKKDSIYRGVLLNDGRFQVFQSTGGNMILEKGEYELISSSQIQPNKKDFKKILNIGLLLGVGYVLYKVIKK